MAVVQANRAFGSIASGAASDPTIPLNIAPIVVATNTSLNSTTTTSTVCNLPAGIVAGDTLVLLFEFGETGIDAATFAGYTATATGWTSISDTRGSGSIATDAHGLIIFTRLADGSEGATVTVTTNNNVRSTHHSYRVDRCTGKVEAIANFATDAVDPYQFDPPGLNPTWLASDYLIIAGVATCTENPTAFTIPSNYSTPLNNQSSWSELTSAHRRVQNVSSEDPGVFSFTGGATTTGGIAFTIIFEALEAAAVLAANSTLSANATVTSSFTVWQGSAVLAATSSWSATASIAFVGRATLPLSSSLAALAIKNPLEAALPVSSSIISNLRQVWATNPAVLAATSSLSVLAIKNPLEATLPLSSFVIANLQQKWVTNPATLPISSTLSALMFGSQQITSVLDLSSSISVSASAYKIANATLPCSSSINCDARVYKPALATLPATSILSAIASIALRGTATLPISSDISANSQISFVGRATLPLTSSVLINSLWYVVANATLPITSSVLAATKWYPIAIATLPINSTFIANTIGTQQGTAVLAGTASFVTDAIQRGQIFATVALAPSSSITCATRQSWQSQSSFALSSNLSCFSLQWWSSRASLTATSNLLCDTVQRWDARAQCNVASTIDAKASQNWTALAKLLATSSILVDTDTQSASAVFPVLNITSSIHVNATVVRLVRHWQRHITATGVVGLPNKLRGAITRPNLTGEVS